MRYQTEDERLQRMFRVLVVVKDYPHQGRVTHVK